MRAITTTCSSVETVFPAIKNMGNHDGIGLLMAIPVALLQKMAMHIQYDGGCPQKQIDDPSTQKYSP